MARPLKQGLDYYSIDTDIFSNRKIRRLIRKFNCGGYLIYSYILTQLYKDKGYYIKFDEPMVFDVSDYLNQSEETVLDVVQFCCELDLFDKKTFDDKSILTSKNIQDFYILVCKRAKRTNYTILKSLEFTPEKTKLVPEVTELSNVESTSNDAKSTQSKVKESKVKKSKEVVVVNNKEKTTTSPLDLDSFFSIDVLYDELLNDKRRLTGIINNKENKFKDLNHLKEKLTLFLVEIKGGGTLTKEGKDFCPHFRNWHKRKLRDSNTNKISNHSKIPIAI